MNSEYFSIYLYALDFQIHTSTRAMEEEEEIVKWKGPRGPRGRYPLEIRKKWVSKLLDGFPEKKKIGVGRYKK